MYDLGKRGEETTIRMVRVAVNASGAFVTGEETKRSHWIAGPLPDLLWVVLCPLLSLLALLLVWQSSALSDRAIYALMFAFIITGHHLPAWLRALGEPAVFQRYKARLWVSVLAVPALVISLTLGRLGVVAMYLAAAFDLWHVAMQQHGLGRIYAVKAGDTSRRSARLDLACALSWYATVVACSDSWMAGLAAAFRKAGAPLFNGISPAAWAVVQGLLLGLSGCLLLVYVAQAISSWRRSGSAPVIKHMLHAVAFGVLAFSYQDPSWHRAQSTQNLFHALQYFFIVWVYANRTLQKQPQGQRGFYRHLFARRRGVARYGFAIALYGLLMYVLANFAFGLHTGTLTTADVPLLDGSWSAEHGIEVLGSFGLTSILLHYYADSFIWRVRSKPVRTALDITSNEGVETSAGAEPAARGALHALAYFGLPTLLILVAGSGTPSEQATFASLQHEAALFPRAASAHHDYGMAALATGDKATARSELADALALSPTLPGPARTLGRLASQRGDLPQAIRFGLAAVNAVPEDPVRRLELAEALDASGQSQEAARQREEAARLGMKSPAEDTQ